MEDKGRDGDEWIKGMCTEGEESGEMERGGQVRRLTSRANMR